MVSKTRQMLSHLQSKTNHMKTRIDQYENHLKRKNDFHPVNNESTDERIEEIKKKAEFSLIECKRQAHLDIQRAVTSTEIKAGEILKKEREKFEKTLEELKKKYLIESSNVRQDDNLLEVIYLHKVCLSSFHFKI